MTDNRVTGVYDRWAIVCDDPDAPVDRYRYEAQAQERADWLNQAGYCPHHHTVARAVETEGATQ